MKNSGIFFKSEEAKKMNSLKAAAEKSEKPVFIIGNDLNFLHFNKAWLAYRGTEIEAELDVKFGDFIHPDDADTIRYIPGTVGVLGEPDTIELRIKDDSNKYNWFKAIMIPEFLQNGDFFACLAYCTEFSGREQYERDSKIIEAVLATDSAGIVFKDRDGANFTWSNGAQALLGYTPQEMMGRTSKDYAPPEYHEEIESINERILHGENVSRVPVVRKHKDGRIVYCTGSYTPIFGEDSTIKGSTAVFCDASEAVMLEQNRKWLENTIANLFKNILDACCFYELTEGKNGLEDLRVVMANEAYAKLFNMSHDKIIGRLFSEIAPKGRENLERFLTVAKTGVSANFEFYNQYLYKYTNIVAYSPVAGKVIVVATDCTRQIEAEEALRERENDLTMLFASMTSGFCLGRIVRDKSGEVTDIVFELVNEAFEEMEGFEAGTLRNMRMKSVMPDCADEYFRVLVDIAVNKSKKTFRKKIASRNTTLDVVSYSPSEDHFVCIENDISERVKAEEELQNAHRDMEALLREIPAPICVINADRGYILDVNEAFIELCKASDRQELLTKPITVYFKQPISSAGHDLFMILHEGGNFKCKMNKLDGSEIDIEVFSSSFIFNEQNAFAIYCIDLTQQKMKERMLEDTARAAEEASKMKSTFLAGFSHEIRTPMSGVLGFTDLALDDTHISKKTKDYLKKIRISANNLLNIVDAVLDITQIEAGKVELERIPFDLREVLKNCETTASEKAQEKGVKLYFYSEPYIANKLVGDPAKLIKILNHLLSNAIKYTDRGVVKLMSITEENRKDKISVHFEIKDTGIGITPERMEKLFEPFAQVDNSITRQVGSTGFGLSITKGLIEAMGGELKVESIFGIGSKFSFDIVFDTSGEPSVFYTQSENTINETVEMSKPTFIAEALVCEDNAINQQIMQEQLAKVGIVATMVKNGKLGVESVKKRMQEGRPFDVIFMDIHMPEMDGLEATQKLIEMGCETPIIAMTANVMARERSSYLSHGMSDYIRKPFGTFELWGCLLRFLTPTEVASIVPEEPDEAFSDEGSGTVKSVINRALGIERTAGDKKLYKRLLNSFIKDYGSSLDEINESVRNGDIKLAHRIAHTLKCVANTIGALELADAAAKVERTLINGTDGSYEEKMKELEHEINIVIKEIKETSDIGTDNSNRIEPDTNKVQGTMEERYGR